MYDIIQNFLNLPFVTYANATFLIALLGLMLSIYNFVHDRLQNRMKIHVIYKNHHISEHDTRELTISLAVENLVQNPISITRIFLNANTKTYEFFWVPQIVYYADYKIGKSVLDEVKVHTVDIPFKIDGYGVVGGFFFIKSDTSFTDEFLLNSSTSITFYTNKGKRTYPISFDNPNVEK